MRPRRRGIRTRHYRTERDSSSPDTLPYRPLRNVTRRGIDRKPRARTAPTLPVTEPQAEVLALLTSEIQSPRIIAKTLDRTPPSVTSSLYGLQERGLAERVIGKGWKKTDRKEH